MGPKPNSIRDRGGNFLLGTNSGGADAFAPVPIYNVPLPPMPVTPVIDAGGPTVEGQTITPSQGSFPLTHSSLMDGLGVQVAVQRLREKLREQRCLISPVLCRMVVDQVTQGLACLEIAL